MKSRIKSALMWLYCHEIISAGAMAWAFEKLNLRNA